MIREWVSRWVGKRAGSPVPLTGSPTHPLTVFFPVVIAGEPPEWTPGDRAALAAYFRSPSGEKLIELIRFYEQGMNRQACLAAGTQTDRACGRAAGFHDCGEWLMKLSATVTPQTDENSEDRFGARDLAERHAP